MSFHRQRFPFRRGSALRDRAFRGARPCRGILGSASPARAAAGGSRSGMGLAPLRHRLGRWPWTRLPGCRRALFRAHDGNGRPRLRRRRSAPLAGCWLSAARRGGRGAGLPGLGALRPPGHAGRLPGSGFPSRHGRRRLADLRGCAARLPCRGRLGSGPAPAPRPGRRLRVALGLAGGHGFRAGGSRPGRAGASLRSCRSARRSGLVLVAWALRHGITLPGRACSWCELCGRAIVSCCRSAGG